jgi:hypothetical protein
MNGMGRTKQIKLRELEKFMMQVDIAIRERVAGRISCKSKIR